MSYSRWVWVFRYVSVKFKASRITGEKQTLWKCIPGILVFQDQKTQVETSNSEIHPCFYNKPCLSQLLDHPVFVRICGLCFHSFHCCRVPRSTCDWCRCWCGCRCRCRSLAWSKGRLWGTLRGSYRLRCWHCSRRNYRLLSIRQSFFFFSLRFTQTSYHSV